jgi:hypothetical protein
MGVVDRAGALEWVAIALAFVAVLVILRYGMRPRCELCRRRHHRLPGDAGPLTVVPDPTAGPVDADDALEADREPDLEIDLTTSWQPNGVDHEPVGIELVAISWRADHHGVRTVSQVGVEATA